MKKVIYLSAIVASFLFVRCSKESINTSANKSNQTESSINNIDKKANTVLINEKNIGDFHNSAVSFLVKDISSKRLNEVRALLSTQDYTIKKLKEYCALNNLVLPSDEELKSYINNYVNLSDEELFNNSIFSDDQQTIIKKAKMSLILVDQSVKNTDVLISKLDESLKALQVTEDNSGKSIAIAYVNQLKSSTIFWMKEGNISVFQNMGYYDKAKKPTNAEVLGADGKGVATTLLFGGWTTPIGWCGAMFVGAGASFGKVIDSNWWPY